MNPDAAITAALAKAAWDEFARGWPVVLGSAIGIAIGIVLPGLAISVVMHDLERDLGWSRTQISLGPTLFFITIALLAPLQGWIVDRARPQIIAACSLAGLSAGLYLSSQMTADILCYYAGFVVLGAIAGGSATIVYAKVVSSWFNKNLGLALALTMMGTGVSQALIPLLLAPYSAENGWRAGATALAGVVAIGTPAVFLLLGQGRRKHPGTRVVRSTPAPLGDALTGWVFWTLAVCFMIIPLAVTGLQLHLLAYLADAGVSAGQAGAIASAGGVALVSARLLTGFLIDRLFAPYVAAAMMALAAAGIAAMELLGPGVAILGAIAIGISVGAELDLVGYLTKRYFGIDRFGRIYGILYGLVLVGMSLSQVGYGVLADATGSYRIALFGAAALLSASALLFLVLPPFREEAKP